MVLGLPGNAKPRQQATDWEDIDLSANLEGCGGVTVPGFLVCETSKAFGARCGKINCREAFAPGTGSFPSRGSRSVIAVTAEMGLENRIVS